MAALVLAALPGGAGAVQSPVQPYQQNDGHGFWSILPPGQNGLDNLVDAGAYEATGRTPPHNQDQLRMYESLVYGVPGLRHENIERYFKDESFGVKPGDKGRRYSPRPDVTIVRDRSFGIPHVYGKTRAGTMFGVGYAQAEDRLFLADVFRRIGLGEASSFVGGSAREFDETVWEQAPYRAGEAKREFDLYDDRFGPEAAQIQDDVRNFTDGINLYIQQARGNPTKMPVEYQALGDLQGPSFFKPEDVVSSGIVLGAILGVGGGNELNSALALQSAQHRFGRRRGKRVWSDFRRAEDPEAPVTVRNKRFPYETQPRHVAKGSVAMPDPGSVRPIHPAIGGPGSSGTLAPASASRLHLPLLNFPRGVPDMSNALLVPGRNSATGRPIAVFGPQTGYFAPQPLVEMDIHGPGIDARGIVVVGTPYVAIGRGRDYAWSATSAGQDYIDTYALDLCDPAGGRATISSMGYRYRGSCRPIDVIDKPISWKSNLVDSTPSGSETLHAERTALGLGTARATIHGRPVIYTKLRATYGHEIDRAALAVSAWDNPGKIRSAGDFMHQAAHMPYTFNWFYVDSKDIGYILGGADPIRPRNVDPNLPVRARKRFEWKGYDANKRTFSETPFRQRPQVVNQSYITNWNNKQARGFHASDANFAYGSLYRSQLLEERIRAALRGRRRMSLTQLIDAMGDAATVDFRGDKVLPWMLRAMGTPRSPALRSAVATLRGWHSTGSHRRDKNGDRVYEDADAVRIMDAWWPRFVNAEFGPVLGGSLWHRITGLIDYGIDNSPNFEGAHRGSAYDGSIYGHVQKDLRDLVRPKRVKGRFSRIYCGGGLRRRTRGQIRRRCAGILRSTLAQALSVPTSELYHDDLCGSQPSIGPPDPGRVQGSQWCFDAISHQVASAITQPLIHWQNRPTWQQAVEIEAPARR